MYQPAFSVSGTEERLSGRKLPGGRYLALDGLRGLAIIAVILDHYGPFVLTGTSFWQRHLLTIAKHCYVGVDLFFVISGFLITGILLDSKHRENYWARFYWRRSLRIFPLYFSYLFLVFVVLKPFYPNVIGRVNAFWYVTYLANWHMAPQMMNRFFAHLWSLCVEEQFYLVWPFVVLRYSSGNLSKFCVWLVISAFAFRLIAHGHLNNIYLYILTPARMDALAIGAIVAIAVKNQVSFHRLRKALIGAALILSCLWIYAVESSKEQTLGYSCTAMLFGVVVFFAADQNPEFLRFSFLRTVGKYSYGLYMYHVLPRDFLFHLNQRLLPSPWYKLSFIASSLLAIWTLAILSWFLLESRFLRLKDAFFSESV